MTIRTTPSIEVNDTETAHLTRGVTWAIKVARCEGVPSICVCTRQDDGWWQEDNLPAAVLVDNLDRQHIVDIEAWRAGVLVPALNQWLAEKFGTEAQREVTDRYTLADRIVSDTIRIEEQPDGSLTCGR